MSKIVDIKAREVLDSRGYPTLEVSVRSEKGFCASALVPSSVSVSRKECVVLRDNDERYFGNGMLKAVDIINSVINESLIGIEISHQKEIDLKLIELDGTPDKSKLGVNCIYGVSVACLKCASLESGKPLYEYLNHRDKKVPKVMFNLISGGVYAKNNLDIKEYMIVPKKDSFKESLRCASEVYQSLRKILEDEGYSSATSFEGAFEPFIESSTTVLNFVIKAIELAGYIPSKDVFIALDIDASSLYNSVNKTYKFENQIYSSSELLDYYLDLVSKYPIISIEDAFSDEDIEGFKLISDKLSRGMNIVGDDLFVTNKNELLKGIENNICNSILISQSQIGTFYEMLETVVLAKKHNYTTIMSGRSADNNDTFIVDVAVALGIPFVKFGSLSRGERICKYNRLLKIEEEITI